MVKTIRFKTDLIKVNKEEVVVLDRVMRALVLKEEDVQLNYRKHSRLDLSNIRQVEATGGGLEAVPLWVKECRNLRNLKLEDNKIEEVDG